MATQVKPAGSKPKVRLSAKVKIAIEKMVDHALSRAEAAQLAGLTDHSLYCALRKPHVQAYRHERMEVLRSSEASRTISRAAKLADTAESEHVRLQANTWLGALDDVAPVERSEHRHFHAGGNLVPGLTIVLQEYRPHVIDQGTGEIADGPVLLNPTINRVGTPQPHPGSRDRPAIAIPVRVPHPSELK